MTDSTQPWAARVFTVGRNQHRAFRADGFKSHEQYLDGLFNRPFGECRRMYEQLGPPGPTRRNTDCMVSRLERIGITDVVQTNVVCFSTAMGADLAQPNQHGAERGREIFKALLEIIRPQVVIAHGQGTAKELRRLLKHRLPDPPRRPGPPVRAAVGDTTYFLIPSLAPPAYNNVKPWIWDHIDGVCEAVRNTMNEVQ